jgi:hypothetical protein
MSWFKSPKWGIRLAAVWFILTGVIQLSGSTFPGFVPVSAILAIAAGVLLLLDR